MIFFTILLTVGCSKKEQPDKNASRDQKEKSPVIAIVGGSPITVADFKGYLSVRTKATRYPGLKEDIRKRLDEMVFEEVLYQEALRLKLDQDPEVRRSIRQTLTQKLMNKQIKDEIKIKEIDESDLQDYYDTHRDEFNRPAQVRLSDILISVPPDATDKNKAERRKKAEMVLAEAFGVEGKRLDFRTLVIKYSDSHEKDRNGDTGYFDIEGKPVGIDKVIAGAAFKLEHVGSLSERVIEASDGYHIIMLTGKRSEINRPLEKVRNQIIHRIRRDRIKKERDEYIEGLKTKADISINNKVLADAANELAQSGK